MEFHRSRGTWGRFVIRAVFPGLALSVCLAAPGGEPAAKKPPARKQQQARQEPAAASESALWSSKPVDLQLLQQFGEEIVAPKADPRQVFERYLDGLGPTAMLDYLDDILPRCHTQAHSLGGAVYARTQDLDYSVDLCGTGCTSGCMHGAVREALGSRSFDEVVAELPGFCRGKGMAGHYKPGNCAHAVGLGLMVASGQDLGRSLEACSEYPDRGMAYYCATGAYMQYFADPDRLELETLTNPHHPCDVQKLFPAACYRFKASVMLTALGEDPQRLARECETLQGAARLGCFHGLGAVQLAQVYARPASLAEVCAQGSPDDRALCIEGVVEKLADYDEERARAACESLEGAARKICTAAARDKMYRLDKQTLPLYTRQ